MKILNLEQNTTEWLEFRRSKIGASDVAKLMTGSKRAINNLFLEKKGGERERAPTSAMRHGHQTEPLARAWTNDFFNTDFEPIVVQHSEIDYLIASLKVRTLRFFRPAL